MRTTSLVAALGVAHAAYDSCDRPVAQWAGVNQANGNGAVYGAQYLAGSVYLAGYQAGDYAFHSTHLDTGATGTHGDDPDAVTVVHATGSFSDPDDDGVMAANPSSQNGWDAVVTKISEAGVFEGIFAVDTMPADGKFDSTSVNSGWGGYSYFNDLASLEKSGDTDHIIASGSFRGKLTFPVVDGAAPVTLENRKWQKYDAFLSKFDVNTHKVVWATGDKLQTPTCNTNTDGTADSECDEPSSVAGSVSTTSAGHVFATSNYGNSGRSTTNGRMFLFNGVDGTNVWEKDLGNTSQLFGTETIGEVAYVAGFQQTNSMDAAGVETIVKHAHVFAIDVTATGSGATKWTSTSFGTGTAISIVADPAGTHLYVGGELSEAGSYTINTACSLTGEFGGFLMKIVAETGECVWATDAPKVGYASTRFGFRDHGLDVDASGTYVYTLSYGSSPKIYDSNHTIPNRGLDSDGFLAKYSCATGIGQWAESIGGQGSDAIKDVVCTPSGGVLIAGTTKSDTVQLGDVTVVNLQHARADAAGSSSASSGFNAHFAMMIHEEQRMSCIDTCISGETTDAVLKDGFCLIGSTCVADGGMYEFKPCFKCDAATSKSELQGPITTNHCYIDDTCRESGSTAPTYARYGKNSVCEVCDPVKDSTTWSLETGYFHDRNIADQRGSGASEDYGLYFVSRSNGCQILPDMEMPTSKSADLISALATPTSATVADIGARATSAISATSGASSGNQGAEIAWAWYLGDATTCTKESDAADVCMYTPSALSDTMAVAFETNLYYGHSVARVKVQQGLAILQSDLVTASTDRTISDLKTDIMAHILIPYYQGAILAAYRMDVGPDKATAQTDGAAYWSVINQAISGDAFAASDRATLTAMFASTTSGSLHFCTVQALLLRNLPPNSNLQYGSNPFQVDGAQGCTEGCNALTAKAKAKEDDIHHVTKADVGVLKVSLDAAGAANMCLVLALPPPSPPPSPNPPPPTLVAASDSGLSTGEIAGVAVGATVGGIVLLVVVGLVLRSLLFKSAKPVFTCLEKAPAEKKAPSAAGHV